MSYFSWNFIGLFHSCGLGMEMKNLQRLGQAHFIRASSQDSAPPNRFAIWYSLFSARACATKCEPARRLVLSSQMIHLYEGHDLLCFRSSVSWLSLLLCFLEVVVSHLKAFMLLQIRVLIDYLHVPSAHDYVVACWPIFSVLLLPRCCLFVQICWDLINCWCFFACIAWPATNSKTKTIGKRTKCRIETNQ